MSKTNEIALARKAIKAAIVSGKIEVDVFEMYRIGFERIAHVCKSWAIADELAWAAVKDVKLGR
jgi:hypothetical protein